MNLYWDVEYINSYDYNETFKKMNQILALNNL